MKTEKGFYLKNAYGKNLMHSDNVESLKRVRKHSPYKKEVCFITDCTDETIVELLKAAI